MSGHECGCYWCVPALRGPAGRQGEGHIAVRFDDCRSMRCSVTLDGRDVSADCFEAMAGTSGYVFLYARDEDGDLHLCRQCGWTLCAEMRIGSVIVVKKKRAT